jgi:hypothetical protein
VFTAAVDGRVYARHGTTIDTRLTVIDRVPADDATVFPVSPGMATDPATLLDWVTRLVPARPAAAAQSTRPVGAAIAVRSPAARQASNGPRRAAAVAAVEPTGVELNYEVIEWTPTGAGRVMATRRPPSARITEALYEGYALGASVTNLGGGYNRTTAGRPRPLKRDAPARRKGGALPRRLPGRRHGLRPRTADS